MTEVLIMSIQVSLKLKLFKQRKGIKVKYNTFEKATYDEYLICSLALRTMEGIGVEKRSIINRLIVGFTGHQNERDKAVYEYIDDITGAGSLNSHFKNIYDRVKGFSKEQLVKIMENSMIPMLKIDEKNRYDYYPQLDISVFNKRIYKGDLEKYSNLPEILLIKEDIIDMSVILLDEGLEPEQYFVQFDDQYNVKVKILNDYIDVDSATFEKSLCEDVGNFETYHGKIHDSAKGDGWKLLNKTAFNNLFVSRNYYFDGGDHCFIREKSVRKTIIAKVNGLHIYREEFLYYKDDADLCSKVIVVLLNNNNIYEFKPSVIVDMLRNVSNEVAQQAVNKLLIQNDDKEVALLGLNLIEKGVVDGWLRIVLKKFLKYASGYHLNLIYQASQDLDYTIEHLIKMDYAILNLEHRAQVDKYNDDMEAKRKTIREITGEITTKGLRERAKRLTSDDYTKKFSKLCNELIGHVSKDLDNVSFVTLEQWHKNALELKEISHIIEMRLLQLGDE